MILAALGRLSTREEILELGTRLCESRPSSKDAERALVAYRRRRQSLRRDLSPQGLDPVVSLVLEDRRNGRLHPMEATITATQVTLRDRKSGEVWATATTPEVLLQDLERCGVRVFVETETSTL